MTDPTITLGGREFPVPELAIKQLRVVFPAMTKLMPALAGPTGLLHISNEDFDTLLDVVWTGVSAGAPNFTRADFDKLPAKPNELVAAVTVIAQQSGMLGKPEASNGAGEAQAAVPSPPIGMESSRASSAQPDGRGTTPRTA